MSVDLLERTNKFVAENLHSNDSTLLDSLNLLLALSGECLRLNKDLSKALSYLGIVEEHLNEVGEFLSGQDYESLVKNRR